MNGVVLCVLVLFIGAAAWGRLFEPPAVEGGPLVLVATAGLVVNVIVARRLREHEHHSLGIRGAYLHVLSDLLGSIGAVVAGVVIWLTGWTPVDAIASAAIAGLVLVRAFGLVREAVDVLDGGGAAAHRRGVAPPGPRSACPGRARCTTCTCGR